MTFRGKKITAWESYAKKMGDAWKFFVALTGEAHSSDGFVAFVGTKSEAFARALHKINGGTKAALARSTTAGLTDSRPFSDWRGFQWSQADKEKVVREKYGEELKDALHRKGLSDADVAIQAENRIQEASSLRNIRLCCEKMAEFVEVETEKAAAKIQSRPQTSPTTAGYVAACKDQFQESCTNCAVM